MQEMLKQIISDQVVIKEQLMRLSAVSSSSSSSSSFAYQLPSLSPVDDKIIDDFVDTYSPKTKLKPTNKQQASGVKRVFSTSLENEKNIVSAARQSKLSVSFVSLLCFVYYFRVVANV